ncbi:MAG: 5'/3'-nucleotidase SurE [Bacteroidales bacterium]|nr:5'/3'-nucleotidase SurE [Bacteroidales bacterium]
MEILLTNDDGRDAKGLKVLEGIMRHYGNVTVVAPKYHQSGMSMAVDLGFKKLAFKETDFEPASGDLGSIRRCYFDATPASCTKFGLNVVFADRLPDLVVSGINHGSNAATASCYSGTLGAVQEAAVRGVRGIGVSLDAFGPDSDFSAFPVLLPPIIDKLISTPYGERDLFYNINFPNLPASAIKGIRASHMGLVRWVREFVEWDDEMVDKLLKKSGMLSSFAEVPHQEPEEGETFYKMVGQFQDMDRNDERSDHRLNMAGYISITAHRLDNTDYEEMERLRGLEEEF